MDEETPVFSRVNNMIYLGSAYFRESTRCFKWPNRERLYLFVCLLSETLWPRTGMRLGGVVRTTTGYDFLLFFGDRFDGTTQQIHFSISSEDLIEKDTYQLLKTAYVDLDKKMYKIASIALQEERDRTGQQGKLHRVLIFVDELDTPGKEEMTRLLWEELPLSTRESLLVRHDQMCEEGQ